MWVIPFSIYTSSLNSIFSVACWGAQRFVFLRLLGKTVVIILKEKKKSLITVTFLRVDVSPSNILRSEKNQNWLFGNLLVIFPSSFTSCYVFFFPCHSNSPHLNAKFNWVTKHPKMALNMTKCRERMFNSLSSCTVTQRYPDCFQLPTYNGLRSPQALQAGCDLKMIF